MDIAVIGAGIAGLSAAWWLRRAGHKVVLYERNYKPGGRMNSRRKAGMVVDHGERYIYRHASIIRELILDCGLHGELRSIDKPVYHLNPDGSYKETREEAINVDRVAFAEGMLALPEALRRSVGGYYSIGINRVLYNEESGKYCFETDPLMRVDETGVDGVIVACAAPEAVRITEPVRERLNEDFYSRLEAVEYDRCLVVFGVCEKVEVEDDFYGVCLPHGEGENVRWFAFEDQKCQGREVEGWSSFVIHATGMASERLWEKTDSEVADMLYQESRKYIKELPEKYHWTRVKHWEIAHLKDPEKVVRIDDYPAASEDVLVEFCGDYRAGDGVEDAAQSGREAAEKLLEKIQRLEDE
jgi:predicted NAD/FAD-dependent oxidoreductase